MQVNAKLHAEYMVYKDENDIEVTYQWWLEDRLVSCRHGWTFAGIMSFLCAALMVLK